MAATVLGTAQHFVLADHPHFISNHTKKSESENKPVKVKLNIKTVLMTATVLIAQHFLQANHHPHFISYHQDSFALFACFNSHEKNDIFHTLMSLYSALINTAE